MAAPISELVERAREELSKLTGLELSSTLGAVKDGNGWRVSVELIEKHSIPDALDILATYEVTMDDDGNVLGFNRKGMRKRVDVELGEEK